MNYTKIYNQLIKHRKENKHNIHTYIERHHIVPKSHGGDDSSDNIVELSAREHFIAHWLLWRIHRDKPMAYAFNIMCWNTYGNRYKNSYAFEEARKANIDSLTGRKLSDETKNKLRNSMIGRTVSDESKARMSASQKGKIFTDETRNKMKEAWIKRKLRPKEKRTDESRKKMSDAKKGRTMNEETKMKMSIANKGRKMSDESKKKMSESAKKVIRERAICKYCGKESITSLITRYHDDNCKSLKNTL